ncbi:MAG TPA: response regulator [Gammaproteobacteria bacterium]|nr:response regulator [Gammaproteobacteria bacterium]
MRRFSLRNLFKRSSTADATTERRKRPRPDNGYDITILVVDDSPTVIAAFTKVLTQAGFQVITAMNGEDGVSKAKAERPDLILMDVVMPGINGYQATRQLRQESMTADTPIIIVSGEQQSTEQMWGRKAGANGFISKPIDRDAFFGKIFECLGEDRLRAKSTDSRDPG